MKLQVDISDNEFRQLLKGKRKDETTREFILRLGGIDAPKRQVGRPRRIPSSLDILGVPGAIRTTSGDEARKELADVYEWPPKPKQPEGE